MDKNFDAKIAEDKWYSFWEEKGLFKSDPTSSKEPYSLLMPPPNLTGSLHAGHAMEHSILDALARYKRLQGFDVLLMPGVDHAGIQFEGTLNKLLSKEDLSKQRLGREAWLQRANQFRDECYKSAHATWKVFGISADWDKETYTLEPKVAGAVFNEFKTFWEQDLLYKGAYIVEWCPKCGTAIEDVEMEYQEKTENLYFINYQIKDNSEFITIATTRPETIYADSGIAIYPNHPKFSQFVGKQAVNPLNGNLLPIFEDDRVDREFGTGALKVTPGHDPLDYKIGKDHELAILHVIDKTGRLTELGLDLAGLKIDEAEKKSSEKLKESGHLIKVEELVHSVPVCERCKTTVEPLISEEWFVKMEPLAKKALTKMGQIKFYPANFGDILKLWMENIHDWCISRSLWWGHRIPVWYCSKCNPNHLVGKDKDMVISMESPAKDCQSCQEKHWVQDEQIFDTWFSSGLWPLATLGWPDNNGEWETMKRYFPWNFELSAGEIKYLWISRMIMLSSFFEDSIPFESMFFHGQIRDLQGRKFSKSLGNGIDPQELRLQWGTDATRMALYTYTAAGREGRANRQTLDERCKAYRNFGTKLWNVAKFIIDLKPEKSLPDIQDNADDKWILGELEKVKKSVSKNIEGFNLHLATEELYNFVWHQLADIYIEKSKPRREESQATLEKVLRESLIMLHPFMPFITEEIYQKLPGDKKESIMMEIWPE